MNILKKISQKFPDTKQFSSLVKNIPFFNGKKSLSLSQKQKINFLDSLYSLLLSGVPLPKSFGILSLQTKDKNTLKLLSIISKNISKGKKLVEIFSLFPNIFSPFDIYMIKMGEITGKLPHSLETILKREEENAELKSKILGALIYPIIVISLSIAMIIGFMTFVIPRVQKMYSDAKVNLPDLTQNVINLSEFIQRNFSFIILFFIFFIIGIIFFKKSPHTKIYADQITLKIPLFGGLIQQKILVIFSQTLGTLLQNGIMIHEALEITKKSLDNAYYEKRITQIETQIGEGIPLSEALGILSAQTKEDSHFPIELSAIVKIGEQTGKLPELLLKISHKYEREINGIVKGLSAAIEPIVIIGVGAIVGTLVMAILLPFFNMVNVM